MGRRPRRVEPSHRPDLVGRPPIALVHTSAVPRLWFQVNGIQQVCQWLTRCQIPKDQPQGMVVVDLVISIGQDQHGRTTGHASAGELDQIQGRIVGPMKVLDDHHGRPSTGQCLQECGEQFLPFGAFEHQIRQAPARLRGNVQQRSQGSRCRQRVERTPQNPDVPLLTGAEPVNQRGSPTPTG